MTEISSSVRSTVRDRWIAWLFIIGSSLFALGAMPSYALAVAGCRSRRRCRPAQVPDVEDRHDQRGRFRCVRHLCCRSLCHTVERRCLERRAAA